MHKSALVTNFWHWLHTAGGRRLVQAVVVMLVCLGGPVEDLSQRTARSVLSLTPQSAEAAVFGPEDFLRSKGKPVTIVRTFSVADPSGAFTLCIDNGGQAGGYGLVDSAVVTLNGLEVASPSDFNETVLSVVRPVSVAADNVLTVELRGDPGSGFTLQIVLGTSCTGNALPVADAGPDQTVFVGDAVQLDGSASSDPEGAALSYQWNFVSVPAGSTATLSAATSATPSFGVDVAGTYVVQLIVDDGLDPSDPDTVSISTLNSPPVAEASPDQSIARGESVQLDGSASSDVDGDPLTFAWSFISIPVGSTATLSAATSATPSFVVDLPGPYLVELIVDDGALASDPDTVTIVGLNAAPVAEAGADQAVFVGELVQLDGTGSTDTDGDPLNFAWSFVSRPSGSTASLDDASLVTPSFVVDLSGTYVLQLVVDDGIVSVPPTPSPSRPRMPRRRPRPARTKPSLWAASSSSTAVARPTWKAQP